MQNQYLSKLRNGETLYTSDQIKMIFLLALPAILSQISSTVMQYIDASMVGSLGANASASIGLVSSTTWMFGGVCFAGITGFSVQVAHAVGAKQFSKARNIMKQGFVIGLAFALDWMSDFFFVTNMVKRNTGNCSKCVLLFFGVCLFFALSTAELHRHRDAAGIRKYESAEFIEHPDVSVGCFL